MTTPPPVPPRALALHRYGPLVGIVAVFAAIAAIVTINGKPAADTATSPAVTTPADPNDLPMTFEEARKQGRDGTTKWVENCDPATGRIKLPSIYAPPCVPRVTGDNGGSTAPGVTADRITVVRYVPNAGSDLLSTLQGKLDPPEVVAATTQKDVELMNSTFALSGRKVELIDYEAQGSVDDAIAARADAQAVIEKYHPFASIGGPPLTTAWADEMAKSKVLCLECGAAVPDTFVQEHAPYIWGSLPTPEEFLQLFADFMIGQMMGRKADHAGEGVKGQERKFGVVHFEQDPPVFDAMANDAAKCGADVGWSAAGTETYSLDIGKLPERATTIISKMKALGVTTIIFLGDPIMPIYLTQEATRQNYFPEWVVTGTVLTDTTALGRLYDQQQWAHAFGISELPARVAREQSEAWRLYRWYFGEDPAAANTSAIIWAPLWLLFTGLHMAGPKLTPETFRDGYFRYPPSGGAATVPQVSFGDHGYFKKLDAQTCRADEPRVDYLGIDDIAVIWWDAKSTGVDEQGKDGQGMWRYLDNGRRYLPGTMAKTDLRLFDPTDTVTVIDHPSADATPPDYPSPPRRG